jgi:hypothetical protein
MGPVGLHNLLLFGSDILTCEIAVASASINTHSSGSSELQLSEDKNSLCETLLIVFPPNLGSGVATTCLHRQRLGGVEQNPWMP